MVCSFAGFLLLYRVGAAGCRRMEGKGKGWRAGGREGGGGAQRCSKWQDQQIGKHFSLSFHLLSCSLPLQLHHCCPRFYDKSDSLRRLVSPSPPASLPPSLPPSLWISPFSRYASDDSSRRAEVQNGGRCCFFLPG